MTVADLAAHVAQLAVEHGVRLVEHPGRAHAHVRSRYQVGVARSAVDCPRCGTIEPGELVASIRPVRSRRSYIVALHELGHLLSDRQHPRRFGRLEREVDATWWAWRTSLIHDAIARSELERQSLGYIARYPWWQRPPAESEAWAQIIDVTHHRPPRKRTPR